jgi:glycerophosphoryl diester phosphodiesterase
VFFLGPSWPGGEFASSNVYCIVVEIIAHRGASFDAPENTLAAFQLAFEQKADAIELDVHLSRDGRIVVIHDFTTHRLAGVDKAVREQDLGDLKLLDFGGWKDARWRGERIPTLREALQTVPPGKRVFIEIKCGAEIIPELERVIGASGLSTKQVVIIGFDYDTICKAKKWMPQIECAWLISFKPDARHPDPKVLTEELIERARCGGLDGLDLAHTGPITAEFMERAHAASLKIYVWTIDDVAVARRMIDLGVNGVATNRPGSLREQLATSHVVRAEQSRAREQAV